MEIIYNLNNYRVNYNTLYPIAENLWECFPHDNICFTFLIFFTYQIQCSVIYVL